MSRVVTITSAATFIPTGYTTNGTVSNGNRAYTSSASTTYATLNSNRNSRYYSTYTFGIDSIPQNSTISSFVVYGKSYVQGTGSSYIGSAATISNNTQKSNLIVLNGTTSNGAPFIVSGGTWSYSDLGGAGLRLYHPYGGNNRNLRFYGADLVIGYSYNVTYYSISATSNTASATISSSANEVESGNSVTITITASSLSNIIIKDNGTDVTNSFTGSGGVFSSTLNNVNADHNFTVEAVAVGNTMYIKQNGDWVSLNKVYKKVGGTWTEQSDLSNLFTDGTIYVNG